MEAFSDNTVKIGRYGSEAIKVSGSVASVSGSFTGSFSGSLFGTSSQALTASFLSGSAISASYAATSSFANTFTVAGTITAQTLVVTTISSSVEYSSGSNIFGNTTANTQTFTGSVNITGSLNIVGAVSGSSGFTGSFSGSFSGPITGSLFGTASQATSASLSQTASVAYSGTGSFTGSFTGSLFGTASQALTASYAMGGSASSILFQTASAAATWSFNHFLQTQYPVFTIYDEGNNVIVPQQITAVDTSSALIYFSSPKLGVAVASKGGYSSSVVTSATTANTAISASFASSGTGTFSGSFSGSFSGVHTGSLFGTASQAITASYAFTASSILPLSQSLFVTGALNLTGSLRVTGSILQNGGALALQDGTILYFSSSWFVPTSTVGTSGTTVTSVGTQFTSAMVGAKLTILGESRIISAFTSTTQVTVDSAYSQNYSGIAAGSWGVFSKAFAAADSITPSRTNVFYDTGGNQKSYFDINGNLTLTSTYVIANNTLTAGTFFSFGTVAGMRFSSANNDGLTDVRFRRISAGIVQIDNGSSDTAYRDLILRNITGSNAFFSSSLAVSGSASVTGSLNVSQGITGSLFGTSSWAQNALTASFLIGGGSGVGFPFTGSAQITGSLGVTGSFSLRANTGSIAFSSNADTLLITGSLIITGSGAITGSLSVSSNVGIGTSSTSGRLTVNTGTNENVSILSAAVGDLRISALNDAASSNVQLSIQGSPLIFRVLGGVEAMRITNTGDTQPGTDNAYSLGVSGTRWSAVWAANGTIQTSDEREKKDIINSDLGLDFVSKLRPVSFKWKVGQNVVTSEVIKDEEGNPILDEDGKEKTETVITPREGVRTHYGLIAQEVETLLDGKDFGGFIHDTETDVKGLRYDQFVPLLIKAIQELSTKLDEATTRIKTLESR
jgi:hypothetical protein